MELNDIKIKVSLFKVKIKRYLNVMKARNMMNKFLIRDLTQTHTHTHNTFKLFTFILKKNKMILNQVVDRRWDVSSDCSSILWCKPALEEIEVEIVFNRNVVLTRKP